VNSLSPPPSFSLSLHVFLSHARAPCLSRARALSRARSAARACSLFLSHTCPLGDNTVNCNLVVVPGAGAARMVTCPYLRSYAHPGVASPACPVMCVCVCVCVCVCARERERERERVCRGLRHEHPRHLQGALFEHCVCVESV
jgi:hypothetical protein